VIVVGDVLGASGFSDSHLYSVSRSRSSCYPC
jgi:precorrin-4 methylase